MKTTGEIREGFFSNTGTEGITSLYNEIFDDVDIIVKNFNNGIKNSEQGELTYYGDIPGLFIEFDKQTGVFIIKSKIDNNVLYSVNISENTFDTLNLSYGTTHKQSRGEYINSLKANTKKIIYGVVVRAYAGNKLSICIYCSGVLEGTRRLRRFEAVTVCDAEGPIVKPTIVSVLSDLGHYLVKNFDIDSALKIDDKKITSTKKRIEQVLKQL